jgi:hypothetical protein
VIVLGDRQGIVARGFGNRHCFKGQWKGRSIEQQRQRNSLENKRTISDTIAVTHAASPSRTAYITHSASTSVTQRAIAVAITSVTTSEIQTIKLAIQLPPTCVKGMSSE